MSTSSEFRLMQNEIATEMLRAAGGFIERNTGKKFSVSDLTAQMSTDMDQLALEMLTLGGDIWPITALPSSHGQVVRFPSPRTHIGRLSLWSRLMPYIAATGACVLAFSLAIIVFDFFGMRSVSLLFLCATGAIGTLYGFLPSIYAVALSVLSEPYFFAEPYDSFAAWNSADVTRLVVFGLCAVIMGLFHDWARRRPIDETQESE